MAEHKLFYYPYASLTNAQLPLLKVAALYFDKLVILDPVGASFDTIGADYFAREAVTLLEKEGILELVAPGAVLAKYEAAVAEAIRRDMADDEFIALCDAQTRATGKQTWTLSLAKTPKDVAADAVMRHVMGDVAREALAHSVLSRDPSEEYVQYDETEVAETLDQSARFWEARRQASQIPVYDEYREGYEGDVEYRYADFPLALGEAIMMNHALFTGILHSDATPIADDAFHSRALAHKLRRATKEPAIQQALLDRARTRQIKAGAFAAAALSDTDLRLPILHPAVPLEEVLEYRQRNPHSLGKARDALGQMARRIQSEPWTKDFEQEIESKTVPDLIADLREAGKERDAWLATPRVKRTLQAGVLVTGGAAVVLQIFAAPITPISLAIGGLSGAAATVLPGIDWLRDWWNGKTGVQENGLHYLLTT